jgi:hypothetical protein
MAAVSVVSGGVLALGVLSSAQAAQVKPQATASTDTQCQALPVSDPASPSPSPTPGFSIKIAPALSPNNPSPSESNSATASGSATPSASTGSPSPGPSLPSPASPSPTGLPSPSGPPSLTGPPSPPDGAADASLDAYIGASPGPSTTSPGGSTGAKGQPELCVSVQRSQASVTRGHTATYIVRVSTRNTSASDVSVTLTAQPASQKATFTTGCPKGDRTSACTVSSVSVQQPAVLHAQIAVAPGATSVKSVRLSATASIVATQQGKALTAAETTAVTSPQSRQAALPDPLPLLPLPLGPIPELNGAAQVVVKAGNVTGLFPVITPSPLPRPIVSAHPRAIRRRVGPVTDSRALPPRPPILPAQVAGLIVLGLAIVITIRRLSRPGRRSGTAKPRG